jgi:hypothetical protein
MDLSLPCPDHTTLSRLNATATIQQQVDHAAEGPIDLIVDSTGLQICGQGEWHSQKHGEKKTRRWKKLHIGVNAHGRIVASTVTESHDQGPSQVPELLSQVGSTIERFIGDGIFDQTPVYTAVENHSPGAQVIIPPRPASQGCRVESDGKHRATQRDQHLLAIESEGRSVWKRTSGYYAQSRAENTFSRFKRIFGGGLRSKRDECQEREAVLACELLTRMQALGRPLSYPVG